MPAARATGRLKLAVLISGEGSNLQAILDACTRGRLNAGVCTVISNRAEARGLRRILIASIPVHVVIAPTQTDREDYDATLISFLERHEPQLIVLAGFMRILSAEFVRRYRGRLLNIHPSLLPKHRGLHTHRRVLEAGEKEHGCSVHFVTEELDRGPVIAQAKVPVRPGDTESVLAMRVQEREHQLYPLVLRWFADRRVTLDADQIFLDGQPISGPRVFEINEQIA